MLPSGDEEPSEMSRVVFSKFISAELAALLACIHEKAPMATAQAKSAPRNATRKVFRPPPLLAAGATAVVDAVACIPVWARSLKTAQRL